MAFKKGDPKPPGSGRKRGTDDKAERILDALRPWVGSWAQPWDFTTSHGTFRVKLALEKSPSCAVLVLANCWRVSFAAGWSDFNPAIERYVGGYGARYRVTDGDRLQVDCSLISVSETLESYAAIPEVFAPLRLRTRTGG